MDDSLGQFALKGVLGEGGMGLVYRAIDTRDGTAVALKVLSRQSVLDEEVRRRFLREAHAGARLHHQNIVTVFDMGEVDGQQYISMELVEGKTLHALLKEHVLDAPRVVEIGIAVAEALREAHQNGIVHRDIKSTNIMLTDGGIVKVMDFGLAKIQNASMLTREGSLLGTVAYMSPEQASGETVDHRTDIFSLGVVLYELLTGTLPFGEQYDMAIVYSILNVEPAAIRSVRSDVPEALETVIFKALKKDLQHRYQTVGALLGDLRRLKAFLDGTRDTMPSVHELVAGTDLREEGPAVPHLTSALQGSFEASCTGRDNELGQLKDLLRKVNGGEGHTLFVSGEAGIGKSRLVQELQTYSRSLKIRPINTRCVFREGVIPYRPFVDAVSEIFRIRGLSTVEELRSYFSVSAPSLLPHLPILGLFLNMTGAQGFPLLSRDQLWDAVLRLLEMTSREKTLFLCIDDLQWADEETLRLLQYLARNTRQCPLLIVGTYRPEDLSSTPDQGRHPLKDIEIHMLQEGCLTLLCLERLSEEDVRRMISTLFRNADFGGSFVETVYRESGGNPLFVMEIMKLLKAEGVIESEMGVFRLRGDFASMSVPTRIQDIVMRRVTGLNRWEREVAEIGAVEGEVFHSETIVRCLGEDRLKVLRALQTLERDHHVVHAQEKVYRFDHAKIRDVLYDTITPELKQEYHRMIGAFLVSHYSNDEGLAPTIAHHLLAADQGDKALSYLVKAAGRARRLFAHRDAVQFLEQAFRESQRMSETQKHEQAVRTETILEELGDVRTFLGDYTHALQQYSELMAGSSLGSLERARILQKMGQVYLSEGDHDRSLSVLDEGERLLFAGLEPDNERPDVNTIRGNAKMTRARVSKARGEYGNAIALIEEGLSLLGAHGDLRERADALNDLGNIFEDQAEYDCATEMFRKSLLLREKIADKKGIAVTYNNLANISCARGDYGNAVMLFRKSLDLMKEIGFRVGIAGTSNNLGTIYQDQGRSREAMEMYLKGLKVREDIGDRPGIAMSYGNLGYVHLDLGDYAKAAEYLEKSMVLQETMGMNTLMSATMSWLAIANAGLEEFDRSLDLATRAVSLATSFHQRWFEGIAHRALGIILVKQWAGASEEERVERLYERGTTHLAFSLTIFDEGRFEHEAARSSLELARAYAKHGDRQQSEAFRQRAIDVFQKLGAMGDLDRAITLTDEHSQNRERDHGQRT